MTCPNCGKKTDGAFCSACGTKLVATDAAYKVETSVHPFSDEQPSLLKRILNFIKLTRCAISNET